MTSEANAKHVLYMDDDHLLVDLFKRILQRRGYRVSGYLDPREGLAALKLNPNDFDLVLTDFNMPGLSGLEVAREAHAIRLDLPIAVISGFITEELKAQALAAGVSELILKPNAVDELCDIVHRLIHPGNENN